jgi:hypothetical protein
MPPAGRNTKTEPPAELKPGTTFALFKPKGQRKYSAKIVLPNGYEEIYDTGKEANMGAVGTANARVALLCKEQGIPKPGRHKVPRIEEGLEPGLTPIEQDASGNGIWKRHVYTIEQRYMIGFRKLEEMLLLGLDDDPQAFVDHVRATVIQVFMGETKKVRAVWGSKTRGRT